MTTHRPLLTFVLSPDNARRIGPEDWEEVEALTLKNTVYLFGDTCVWKLLHKSHLSVGIYNDDEQLAGVLCLHTSPNIPALPPWDWEHWLDTMYPMEEEILPLTTLWIHYAVWDRRYTSLFMKPLLQHVFQKYEPLQNVLMVCPPGINRLDFIDAHATRVLPKEHVSILRTQSVYVAKKSDFVAHYVIRRAVEEDNDDLVAIIPKVCEEKYGQFYISEILSNEESLRQIIVAEHKGCAVGVLCLNEVVNYDLLNEEFELVPYNGLKKHNVADEVEKSLTTSATMLLATEDSQEHLSKITLDEEVKEEEERVEEEHASDDDFSLVNLSSSMILNFLYEEEELSEQQSSNGSAASIESHFSAVVLNEEYEDHLYNAERGGDAMDEGQRIRRKESRQDNVTIPIFYGEPDAFAMEICTAIPEHENALFLLFQAAFECFPDRGYMVSSYPSNSQVCYLSRHFARVVPRNNSLFDHELYVLHRNAVLGKLWVRVSIAEDQDRIKALITSLVKPHIVEEMLRAAVEQPGNPYKAYTFLCEKQIIGCAIVKEEEEHEYLQLHYNIDDWLNTRETKYGNIGHLEQFLLSPIFQCHVKFFIRELHRMSDFECMMYRLKSVDLVYTHKAVPIINCISNMLPVLPNPEPQYSKQIKEEYQLPTVLEQSHQPFGLYISTTRVASMIRVVISYRVVVVGAGSTAISFLESLIFGRNPNHMIVFPNITIVSPHGIAYHKQASPLRDVIFVSDGHLDRGYLDAICLRTYVHIVTGVMTTINRKEKFITLNDDSHIPYDYLFLMCGEQFQKPPSKKKEVVKRRGDFPQNVFIINTEADAGNAFNALKNLPSGQKQGNMVVFGHYLEACCCLSALLEFGVPGSNLVYVDPSYDHISSTDRHEHLTLYFNNSAVETAVMEELLAQGVTIYQDYNFVEWHMDSSKNFITSAKFESKYKFVDIELSALFLYHSKQVSARTFQAIARSGLVFNGRLVIDRHCQTNDPCIYGAGPLTMYSKKYHAEHMTHKYYNAQEIGYFLGIEIRKKLIPEEFRDPPVRYPRYRKPVIQLCRFPGQLHYLHVSKPGPPVPLDVASVKSNYGRVLHTGDCKKLDQRGYFRLHFNQFQVVETITCLSKVELPFRNLISLWGRHEILLNHIFLRYDINMIPDLFEYFEQPWAAALYHRNFARIFDEIFDNLLKAKSSEGVKLVDEVRARLEGNSWNPLTKMQLDEIEEVCRDMNLMPMIENKMLEFLNDSCMYLPMYAHQMLIRWIMHQVQTSPLFVKTSFGAAVDKAGIQIPYLRRSTLKPKGAGGNEQ